MQYTVFILVFLLSMMTVSAGFLDAFISNPKLAFTGSLVQESSSNKSCIKDTILYLRLHEPNTFAGKAITLLEVNEEGIVVQADSTTASIPNYGQATVNGVMIILGDIFKKEDPGNTLALVKVRSQENSCKEQEKKLAGTKQCTLKFKGTRGDTAIVGGKRFRLIDLYKDGALVEIDGIPARISNSDLKTINDVSLIVYKNDVATAQIYLVNEYCCSAGLATSNPFALAQKRSVEQPQEKDVVTTLVKFLA